MMMMMMMMMTMMMDMLLLFYDRLKFLQEDDDDDDDIVDDDNDNDDEVSHLQYNLSCSSLVKRICCRSFYVNTTYMLLLFYDRLKLYQDYDDDDDDDNNDNNDDDDDDGVSLLQYNLLCSLLVECICCRSFNVNTTYMLLLFYDRLKL